MTNAEINMTGQNKLAFETVSGLTSGLRFKDTLSPNLTGGTDVLFDVVGLLSLFLSTLVETRTGVEPSFFNSRARAS